MDVGCCSSQAVRPPRQLDLLPWDPVVPPTLPIKSPTPEPPSQAQDEATTHTTTLSMSSFRGQGRHEFEAEDEGEVDEELEEPEQEQEQEQEGQSCSTTSSNSRRRGGDDVGVGVGVPRKKLRLSKEQSVVLEHSFRGNTTLNPRQKQALAKQLGLLPRQVEVWFQNRRARTKLKQTEMECEHLRRCCEMLTQQNARLRRELQELRALKLCAAARRTVHAAAGTATGGTSLRMCPSCERLAAGTGAGAGRPQRAMTVQPEADKST